MPDTVLGDGEKTQPNDGQSNLAGKMGIRDVSCRAVRAINSEIWPSLMKPLSS